jgi:hypothetical protein
MGEARWPELPDPPSEGLVILHLARLVERGWELEPTSCDCCRYAALLLRDADGLDFSRRASAPEPPGRAGSGGG